MSEKEAFEVVHEGKHIEFRHVGPSESGVTQVWAVFNKNEEMPIGVVSWFGRWRKYAFTAQDAVFEENCLRDIADFIVLKTKEHRSK